MQLKHLWGSPTLRVTTVFGITGLGFVISNLLLARALSHIEYAVFALVLALIQIGMPMGAGGAEVMVNRRRMDPGLGLLSRVLITSSIIAATTVIAGAWLYGLDARMLALLLLSVIAGAFNAVAAAQYQSRQRFQAALWLSQSQNFVLLLAAAITLVWSGPEAWLPCTILAFGYIISASVGWAKLFSEQRGKQVVSEPFFWTEALSIVGISAAGLIMIQLERLIVPKALSLEALATLAVLAAIAGSPFRMLQIGVGYTMLPRLRAADSVEKRRRLLIIEGKIVAAVAVSACVAVWVFTPLIVDWFLADKYTLSPPLIFAVLVAGLAKVGGAFAISVLEAVGSAFDLRRFNIFGWASVCAGAVGGIWGTRWGLTGVIYGVGCGWLVRALTAWFLAWRHLRPV